MTGYHDYLIVLSPPDSIVNRVRNLKRTCYEQIGDYNGLYSKAHITIQALPRKKQVWIEPLIPKLERELQRLPSAILDINGFSYFAHLDKCTIFANINQSPATDIWFRQLKKFFGINRFEPHMTIAHTIPNPAFNKLWLWFKNSNWEEQFKVDYLTILRRETIGYDKTYKVYKEIPFNHRIDFNMFTNSKIKLPGISEKTFDREQFSLF